MKLQKIQRDAKYSIERIKDNINSSDANNIIKLYNAFDEILKNKFKTDIIENLLIFAFRKNLEWFGNPTMAVSNLVDVIIRNGHTNKDHLIDAMIMYNGENSKNNTPTIDKKECSKMIDDLINNLKDEIVWN